MSNTFNPIKEEKDGVIAKRMVWSTEAINLALKGLEQGRKLVANPFYENNSHLLKGDLVFERSIEEKNEWKRCATDIVYFAEKYCKLMTPEGIQHIKLRDYQKRYLLFLVNNHMTIYLACRQASKSTSSAIYLLWYVLFNFDKNSLIIADIRKHAVEILDKTKKIFDEIPYFLKPGVYKWNESEIVFDNGCRIMASATTATAAISYTFAQILWDEAAHLKPSFMEKFYTNLLPTIVAQKAKFMITSTQGGYNLFYRLYKAAEAGDNDYKAFKTDWWEVPEWNPEKRCWEKRDELWHQRQVANYGSEEAFNSQFGTDFDVDVKTLINKNILRKCQQSVQEFVPKDLPGVSLSGNFYWKPDYDPVSQLRNDYIVLLGDLAEGVEKDYTNFSICRLIEPESDKLECVGYYRSNDVDRKDIAKALMELTSILCDINHTLLSFERNTYGELFLKHIEDFEEKGTVPGFDKSILVKFFNDSGTRFEYGVRITRGNKNSMCLLFKEDFEKGRVINQSTVFCNELLNFSDIEDKGVWKAAFGHDDAVMSMIQFEAVKKTLQFTLLKQEFDATASHPGGESNFNPYGTIYDDPTRDGVYDRFVESGFGSIYDFDINETRNRLNRLGGGLNLM